MAIWGMDYEWTRIYTDIGTRNMNGQLSTLIFPLKCKPVCSLVRSWEPERDPVEQSSAAPFRN